MSDKAEHALAAAATQPGTPLAQAGISVRHHAAPGLEFEELQGLTLARLYGLGPAPAQVAAFALCGLTLPLTVNGCAGQDPAAVCLAPGEWLVSSAFLDFRHLSEQLAPALGGGDTLLLELSAGYACFRLAGPASPWLLQKLSGLDLLHGIAGGPHAAQTRLDQAAVILHYHQPGGRAGPFVFDLVFERSLARYVWQLLLFAAPHAAELSSQHGIPA
jgi:heterotetrameric sarcosine oxidase gamma subunit